MKYRVRYVDTSWLFFTPFSFLNMGGTDLYVLECKKHWWSRWKKVGSYSSEKDAYKKLKELKNYGNYKE